MKIKKLKFSKINFRSLATKLLNHLKITVSVIIALIVVFTFSYLYKNFYKTITSTQKIIVLQTELTNNYIKAKSLEDNKQSFINKLSLPEIDFREYTKLFTGNNPPSFFPNDSDDPSPRTSF